MDKINNRTEVELSHERCRKYGISEEQVFSNKIIKDNELQSKYSENRNLVLTATPYIEQLLEFLKGSNFFALLTDGEGCILNAYGDETILTEAFNLRMVPGAYMNEESIGTNAMSIVIDTEKPAQISGEDHFIKAYHRWTCSAAPIKDNHDKLIGVLNLTGYTEFVHPHTLGMIIAASNAIEEKIRVKEYNKLQNANNRHIKTIFNSMPVAIVSCDISGTIKIYNNKAIELLGDRSNNLRAKVMDELIEDWDKVKDDVCSGRDISRDVNILALRNKFPCHLLATTIYYSEDDDVEIVCVFEEIKKAKVKSGYQAYYTFDKIVGEDKNLLKIIQYAKKIADSKSTILISGESGTGKEVFAQSIHNYSKRMDGPFIALNCGAIPHQLIESELFGYEEGAFTGAKAGGNLGKFEMADKGTIMLDEIGEMPLDMQTKLLRVLQEGVITRIGSSKEIPVDVRIIAATNKDLKSEVELGRFRKDLYYRLNVLPIYLPPLRERKGDILILINYFMKNISERINKPEVYIPEQYLKAMINYRWPGNIRELENVIELIINTESIPYEYFGQLEPTDGVLPIDNNEYLDMEYVEREHLLKVLKKCNGNISQSAVILGIRRNTLYSKIKKYGIKL